MTGLAQRMTAELMKLFIAVWLGISRLLRALQCEATDLPVRAAPCGCDLIQLFAYSSGLEWQKLYTHTLYYACYNIFELTRFQIRFDCFTVRA